MVSTVETSVLGPSRSDPKSNQVVEIMSCAKDIICHQADFTILLLHFTTLPRSRSWWTQSWTTARWLASLSSRGSSSAQTHRWGARSTVSSLLSKNIIARLTLSMTVSKTNITENSTSLQEAVTHDPSLTFWTYLLVRTVLGVLTAARLLTMNMPWPWSDNIYWHIIIFSDYLFLESFIKLFLSSAWWCLRALWWPPFKN